MITEREFTDRVTAEITDVLGYYGHDVIVTVSSIDETGAAFAYGRVHVEIEWSPNQHEAFDINAAVSRVPRGPHGTLETVTEFETSEDGWTDVSELWAWLYFRALELLHEDG